MKKKYLVIAAMALVMYGCTDQQFFDETTDLSRASAQVSVIEMLKEQSGGGYLRFWRSCCLFR